ncbi:hypothetical protein GGF38_001985 [Coemansia sp. RSA 25]|nr:hypothetical protein GGF38_001985 [Coemansia sp. RSA 25]
MPLLEASLALKKPRGCAPIHASALAWSNNPAKPDARHQEFCQTFLAALKEASTRQPEPLPVNKTAQAIDQQLAGALKELFTKYEVPVTPQLLERRKQLRSSYPELFKDITDEELDS